ncbi:DUF7344 domain-containing protein [Halogranum amylolyticum]|nr:hypothetical protein [Halogranum amylolyticum]
MSTKARPPADETSKVPRERSLSRDELFHLLQSGRRRAVVRYLCDHRDESTFEMRDIAVQVAAWENDKPVDRLESDERQRVYIALYQSHLPKLDEAGVIEYNQSRGWVESMPLLDRVEQYLVVDEQPSESDNETDEESISMRYYGGATALSVGLLVASSLGLAPALAGGWLATLITGLFATITLVLSSRKWNPS